MRTGVRVFGVPAWTDGERTLVFVPERRFRLLGVLAVQRDWIGRDALAHLFWPDHRGDAARRNLRKLLLEVRALEMHGLEETAAGLRWRVDSDLLALDRAVAATDWDTAGRIASQPLLKGLDSGHTSTAFESWLQYERAAAHARWRDGMLRELAHMVAGSTDAAARATAWCDRLLHSDPLDEAAMAQWLRVAAGADEAMRTTALESYRRYASALMQTLGLEPSDRLRGLAQALRGPPTAPRGIVSEAPPAPQGPARSFAPPPGMQASPLWGRESEQAALQAMLGRPDCRLVTLIGPGGCGKSALAHKAMADWCAAGDGATRPCWWLALDDLATPAALPGRIAEAVSPGRPLGWDTAGSLARLMPEGPCLLVLDGFEHLIDAASMLQRLLADTPGLRLLVTSRERLEIEPEWLLPLAGLGAPAADATPQAFAAHPAVQLFVHMARRVQPAFDAAYDAATMLGVRRMCAATDGLPLALVLAAPWVRLMPCTEIAREIEAGGSLLDADGGARMQSTCDHSWALLTPAERRAFTALAVFRGGFTRDAAQQVADAALPVLASLVDKSMLRVDGQGRFDFHALLRADATRRLAEAPHRLADARARHGQWALTHLRRHLGVIGGGHADKRKAMELERDNLLAAWQRWVDGAEHAPLEAAAEVWSWFHVVQGRLAEGAAMFAAAAQALQRARPVTAALMRAHEAWLALWLDRIDDARQFARAALPVLEQAAHLPGTVLALRTLAHAARRSGQHAESARLLADALRRARPAADARTLAMLLDAHAMALNMLGRHPQAVRLVTRAMALNDLLGNEAQRMYNEFNLSQAHAFAGDAQAALAWAEAAAGRAERIGYRFFQPYALCQRAWVRLQLGQTAQARADVDAGHALADSMDGSPAKVWAQELRARLALDAGDAADALATLRAAAQLASDSGNLLMGAALVPVAAAAMHAAGDRARAIGWLAALATCTDAQAPVQREARALLKRWGAPSPAAPAGGASIHRLLNDIAHAG